MFEVDCLVQGWPQYKELADDKQISLSQLLSDVATTNVFAGYSLRLLSSSYLGPCIRVRRSTDGATQDIGFTGNIVDVSAILSFVGSGNGFVHTWYDQSGNNRNLIQASVGLQPQIVNSGSLIADAGLPCMQLDGVDDTFTLSSASATLSVFAVINTIDSQWMLSGGSTIFVMAAEGNNSSPDTAAGSPNYYRNNGAALERTRQALLGSYSTGVKLVASVMPLTGVNGDLFLFRFQSGGFNFAAKVSELIFFSDDKTAERGAIVANIAQGQSIVLS
ncbi:arabinofuranosidase catalytic domain-containing protein [Synechococcus elongatus]|uniref:arabinofuranosidase catalytic domain-containing protein n=1 Tax=Synechococcus elongatus TaxID=32046 RepID=UPI000F7D703F|nr:arabinofuranosidase catalytic domain-containing protein [Synechococcus elongatus]